jgi:hypothetical protein
MIQYCAYVSHVVIISLQSKFFLNELFYYSIILLRSSVFFRLILIPLGWLWRSIEHAQYHFLPVQNGGQV